MIDEIAGVVDRAPATVKRDINKAKAFIRECLTEDAA